VRLAPVALAGGLALALLGPSGGAIAGSGHARPLARAAVRHESSLQVIEVEYRLILSRATVKAGRVNLEDLDRGMDPHNLRLRYATARHVIASPLLHPEGRWRRVVYLKPGYYDFYCSLPEHEQRGMHAVVHVVP
jgi:hypothetical protein